MIVETLQKMCVQCHQHPAVVLPLPDRAGRELFFCSMECAALEAVRSLINREIRGSGARVAADLSDLTSTPADAVICGACDGGGHINLRGLPTWDNEAPECPACRGCGFVSVPADPSTTHTAGERSSLSFLFGGEAIEDDGVPELLW